MITLHDVEQGSEAWQQARQGMYTGSNAFKLLSSFGAGVHAQSEESSFTGSFHTDRGHLLESEAIEVYEEIRNESVATTGFVTNDAYPNALYSPDGLTGTHVIEVKCFAEKNHMEIYNATDWMGVPKKILAQIQFGLLICDKQAGRLVIYNPKLEPKKAFKIIEVPKVQKIQDNFKRILTGVTV